MELLNHVSGCPHISEGQYICPYHHRPESFMYPQKRSHLSKPTRRHFLKYAFTTIYRLGTKSLQKAIHPAKLNVIHHERRRSKKRRFEDEQPIVAGPREDDKRDPMGPEFELDSTVVGAVSPPSPSEVTVPTELPSRTTRVFEMEGILPIVVEPPRAELASKRFSTASSESAVATTVSASSTSSPVSPVTSEQFFSSKDFDSPISPADVADIFQWPSNERRRMEGLALDPSTGVAHHTALGTTLSVGSEQPQSLWPSIDTRATARFYPNIRIDTTCANSRPVEEVSPSLGNFLGKTPSPLAIESQTGSPVKLVEELRGLFNTNYKISYAKLIQPPPSPAITSVFEEYHSAASMFAMAWQAVAKVIRGTLPDTLAEIFALTHLGYACAMATQEVDLFHQLQHIFQDLTNWSNAIPFGQDRVKYLSLIQKLFSPPALDAAITGLGDPQDTETALLTPTQFNRASPGRSSSFPASPSDSGSRHSKIHLSASNPNVKDFKKLYVSLKNGPIVRLCVQYLSSE